MMVWVWLGNIFQLPSPQPWPRGSKSVRLFLSVAFPRIPCLSACQHLSCLLTNSGCCFCLPRVSWNRRKKKKKKDWFPRKGSLGVQKETSLNVAVLYIWLNFTNLLLFDFFLFVDVRMRWPVGSDEEESFLRRVNTRPTFPIFHPLFFSTQRQLIQLCFNLWFALQIFFFLSLCLGPDAFDI